MGTWRRGGGGIRRSHFVAMAHLKAELWLVRWYQNKHGGPNESNKAFENKCYLLYEINIFRINNLRMRKVIHGWLSAWPAGSHRLVSWFPGSAKASPGNQETRRRDQLVPQTINHGFPYTLFTTTGSRCVIFSICMIWCSPSGWTPWQRSICRKFVVYVVYSSTWL